jgi:tyrosyl-tRNA synthetase
MTQIDTDTTKIDELLSRGVDEIIGIDNLRERLLSGEQLRIKLGIDPTSPNIHLGRAVALLKLRDFQQLGHKIVLIVGDFTGVIGDTSDKDSERPMLTEEEINKNKESYFAQIGMVIDLNEAEMTYNSDWLGKLTYKEIGEQANQFSVADFTARDNIRRRLDAGKRVSLREMLYPLMQGYDSVAIEADVEIGGTDQRFNMLSGRTLQEHFDQKPQAIIMGPLIDGLDGRKMSSSWGNTINLTDEPNDMYGKVMSMHDELVPTYFEICTRLPMEEVRKIQEGLKNESLHPRDAKMRLASEIVTLYHGDDAAKSAQEAFVNIFQHKENPSDMPEVAVAADTMLLDFCVQAFDISKSETRRLLEQNGVKVNDETVTDEHTVLSDGDIIKLGKRRFAKVQCK